MIANSNTDYKFYTETYDSSLKTDAWYVRMICCKVNDATNARRTEDESTRWSTPRLVVSGYRFGWTKVHSRHTICPCVVVVVVPERWTVCSCLFFFVCVSHELASFMMYSFVMFWIPGSEIHSVQMIKFASENGCDVKCRVVSLLSLCPLCSFPVNSSSSLLCILHPTYL